MDENRLVVYITLVNVTINTLISSVILIDKMKQQKKRRRFPRPRLHRKRNMKRRGR